MRQVISVSISEGTLLELREALRHSEQYRNKSHFIETAIRQALKEEAKETIKEQ